LLSNFSFNFNLRPYFSDDERYTECVYYLKLYAPQLLAHFMFRHGRAAEACTLVVSAAVEAAQYLSGGGSSGGGGGNFGSNPDDFLPGGRGSHLSTF